MSIIQSIKRKFLANRSDAVIIGGQAKQGEMADPMRGYIRSGTGAHAPIQVAEPVERLGAPLSYLRPETIEQDYRWRINRGMLTIPTWALNQALTVCPMIADKVRFWCGAVKQLRWEIKIPSDSELAAAGIDKVRAEKQLAALKEHYAAQDVEGLVDHLARAKFYGYSIISKTYPRYSPLDWWNFVRNGMYGDWYWNGDLRITNSVGLPETAKLDTRNYIVREYKDPMLLEMLKAFINVTDVEKWWNRNLEQESRRQCVVIAGGGLANPEEFMTAAKSISEGRSGYLEGGSDGRQTQVVFPPASRGLAYFSMRLDKLDEQLTKSLEGGTLMQLARSGSGSLAGSAHQDTWSMIIAAEAKSISEIFQTQNDAPFLRDAGLLGENETPCAHFYLMAEEPTDATREADITAKLRAAGIKRDLDALGGKLGEKLEEAEDTPTGGGEAGGTSYGETFQAGEKRPVGGRQLPQRRALRNRADSPDGGKILAAARAEIATAHQADLLPVARALNELYRNADKLTPARVKMFCDDELPAMLTKHGATDASVKAWQAFLSGALMDGLGVPAAPAATDKPDDVANRGAKHTMTPEEKAEYDDLVNRARILRDAALRGEHPIRNNKRAEKLEQRAQAIERGA